MQSNPRPKKKKKNGLPFGSFHLQYAKSYRKLQTLRYHEQLCLEKDLQQLPLPMLGRWPWGDWPGNLLSRWHAKVRAWRWKKERQWPMFIMFPPVCIHSCCYPVTSNYRSRSLIYTPQPRYLHFSWISFFLSRLYCMLPTDFHPRSAWEALPRRSPWRLALLDHATVQDPIARLSPFALAKLAAWPRWRFFDIYLFLCLNGYGL